MNEPWKPEGELDPMEEQAKFFRATTDEHEAMKKEREQKLLMSGTAVAGDDPLDIILHSPRGGRDKFATACAIILHVGDAAQIENPLAAAFTSDNMEHRAWLGNYSIARDAFDFLREYFGKRHAQ